MLAEKSAAAIKIQSLQRGRIGRKRALTIRKAKRKVDEETIAEHNSRTEYHHNSITEGIVEEKEPPFQTTSVTENDITASRDQSLAEHIQQGEGAWAAYQTSDGTPYWFNAVTQESSWTDPFAAPQHELPAEGPQKEISEGLLTYFSFHKLELYFDCVFDLLFVF